MNKEQSKRFIEVLLRPSTVKDLEGMLSENFSEFTRNCIREELAKRKGTSANGDPNHKKAFRELQEVQA